jgi:hypothetical protein
MRIFTLLMVAACASHRPPDAPSDQRMFTMPGEARVAGADCPLKFGRECGEALEWQQAVTIVEHAPPP